MLAVAIGTRCRGFDARRDCFSMNTVLILLLDIAMALTARSCDVLFCHPGGGVRSLSHLMTSMAIRTCRPQIIAMLYRLPMDAAFIARYESRRRSDFRPHIRIVKMAAQSQVRLVMPWDRAVLIFRATSSSSVTTMPPSPVVRFLLAKKLKQPISPQVPAGRGPWGPW